MNRKGELNGIGTYFIAIMVVVILLTVGSSSLFFGYLDYNNELPDQYSSLNSSISEIYNSVKGDGQNVSASKDLPPGTFDSTEIGFFKRSLKGIASMVSATKHLPKLFDIFKQITFFSWIPDIFWNFVIIILASIFAILALEAWLRYKVL